MSNVMHAISKWLVTAAFLACSGCNGADMSDARRDYILAGDHGWIDLTLKAPAQAPDFNSGKSCLVSLSLDGEPLLNESADLAQAEAHQNLIGYRFVAPAGKHQAELVFSVCVKQSYAVKLELPLNKDHLAKVLFDGNALVLQGSSAYEPTSLEWVRTEILKLQAHDNSSSEVLSTLIKLAIASLALNLATLLYIVWKQRRV